MIVRCPSCSSRYSLDGNRLGGKRVTLRCQGCREVFKVEVPKTCDCSSPEVLVAHSDPALCGTISEVLSGEGFACRVSYDGFETLRCMEAAPPQVLLIDVALQGLLAFEVVETIRSRPALESVKVILMSSVYNRTAYKRSPSSLYGADDYIEKHHVPDLLAEKIRRLLPGSGPSQTRPMKGKQELEGRDAIANEPLEKGSTDELNAKIQRAEDKEISPRSSAEGVEKARRLARIIVSDIALYHQDRVEDGIRTGKFFQLLATEIEEGRRLFRERVAPELCRQEDFLGNAFWAFVENREKELGVTTEEKVV
jgi:predicted Zn finger-like uncharacterized protein